jgi:hypothetical protein
LVISECEMDAEIHEIGAAEMKLRSMLWNDSGELKPELNSTRERRINRSPLISLFSFFGSGLFLFSLILFHLLPIKYSECFFEWSDHRDLKIERIDLDVYLSSLAWFNKE